MRRVANGLLIEHRPLCQRAPDVKAAARKKGPPCVQRTGTDPTARGLPGQRNRSRTPQGGARAAGRSRSTGAVSRLAAPLYLGEDRRRPPRLSSSRPRLLHKARDRGDHRLPRLLTTAPSPRPGVRGGVAIAGRPGLRGRCHRLGRRYTAVITRNRRDWHHESHTATGQA